MIRSALLFAEALGASSVAWLWGPVAAWTAVAAVVLLAGRQWGVRAPMVTYRGAQAALFALPIGFALALVVDPAWLPTWGVALAAAPSLPVPSPSVPAVQPTPAEAAVSALAGIAWPHVLAGALTVVSGLAALVGLARLLAQAVRVRCLRHTLPRVETDGLDRDAVVAANRVGLRKVPGVMATSAAVVPMTLGVRRPLVVVPASLAGADRRLALAHEFIHVRQADPLAHAAEAVTAAVFGLHPLVHRLTRQCDLYREIVCDAAVLADAGIDRRSYAALVSSFATQAHRLTAPALGMAARRPHVHQRLLAMTQPRTTSRFAVPLSLTLLAVAVVTVMAGSAVAQPARVTVSDGPQVVFVDGDRVVGQLDDLLDTIDIHSVDITEQEGSDPIVRVVTRKAAEARGLPSESGGAIRERAPSALLTIRTEGTDESGVEVVQEVRLAQGRASGDALVADLDLAQIRVAMEGPVESDVTGIVFIDGVQVDRDALGAHDPFDIASVEVLRGERATADYGTAGADGVILIVTKSAGQVLPRAAATAQSQAVEGLSVGNARPNPATEKVSVPVLLAQARRIRAEVYDLTGRLVLEQDQLMPAGTSSMTFDVSGLAPGGYVIRATGVIDGRRVAAQQRFTVAR